MLNSGFVRFIKKGFVKKNIIPNILQFRYLSHDPSDFYLYIKNRYEQEIYVLKDQNKELKTKLNNNIDKIEQNIVEINILKNNNLVKDVKIKDLNKELKTCCNLNKTLKDRIYELNHIVDNNRGG